MSIKSRIRRLEAARNQRPIRCVVQQIDVNGTATPTAAEVQVQCDELEAQGFEPCVVKIRYVEQRPHFLAS